MAVIEQYANAQPMPASSLEWLMGLVAERREAVDEILLVQGDRRVVVLPTPRSRTRA